MTPAQATLLRQVEQAHQPFLPASADRDVLEKAGFITPSAPTSRRQARTGQGRSWSITIDGAGALLRHDASPTPPRKRAKAPARPRIAPAEDAPVITADGVDMGSYAAPQDAFLARVHAWTKLRQPCIASAATHRRREVQEREAGFQLAQAATLLAWHIGHRAAIATGQGAA